ncbi:TetR/AcrR family transcriptional regulator [Kiloniella sp. EL199]|uniref:TetR/AcrR family transcriptional regulator n=1 Tax=Kiloniella sp. EL199 TaxID=2107581 RepID=UPI000EA2B9BC|nr:TetR/AcrR family transcriptional regulator [Kiloniella sp. EL199]
MARRVDHSPDELKMMILDAAQELVVAGGISELSARKIAQKIGYAPGTIYNVYANIDELILTLNGRTLEGLYDHLSMICFDNTTARLGSVNQNVEKLLIGYLAFIDENKSLWRLLFDHVPSNEEGLPDWYNQRVSKLLGVIDQALSPLLSERTSEERRHISATLWASLHGIISLADKKKLDVVVSQSSHDVCSLLITTFLKGLKDHGGLAEEIYRRDLSEGKAND